FRVEDRDGLAALAFDHRFLRLPSTLPVRNRAQSSDQIMLDYGRFTAARQLNLCGRCCAAEGADQRFLGGIPLRLAAAGGAGEFFLSDGRSVIHLSNAINPACSKCRSPVKASRNSASSIATNETQSVRDHCLSGRS